MLNFLGQEAVDRLDAVDDKLDSLDPGKYSNAFLSGQLTANGRAVGQVMERVWGLESKLDLMASALERHQDLLCRVLGNAQRVEDRIFADVKKKGRQALKNARDMVRSSLAIPEESADAPPDAVAGQPGGTEAAEVRTGEAEDAREAPPNSAGGDADGPDGAHPTGL